MQDKDLYKYTNQLIDILFFNSNRNMDGSNSLEFEGIEEDGISDSNEAIRRDLEEMYGGI